MYCPKCGNEYNGGVCPRCGTYNDPLGLKEHSAKRMRIAAGIMVAVAVILLLTVISIALEGGFQDEEQTPTNASTAAADAKENYDPTQSLISPDGITTIFNSIALSGISVSNLNVYPAADDPSAGGQNVDYLYSGLFYENRLSEVTQDYRAGKIMVFASPQSARDWAEKLQNDESGQNFHGYKIVSGNFLLTVNSLYTPAFAEAYAAAISGEIVYTPTEAELLFIHKDATNTVGLESEDADIEASREDAYIAQCQSISYEELARNPLSYVGTPIRLRGSVLQVQESGDDVIMLLQVTQDEWGFGTDNVYLKYTRKSAAEPHVLESDIIVVYGDSYGQETYTSLMGQVITIPGVDVKYVVIE